MKTTLRHIRKYSIRTILMCISLIACGFSFVAYRRSAVARHYVAINGLRDRGAQVELIRWAPDPASSSDKVLTHLGMTPHAQVHFIDLRSSQYTEAKIRSLIPLLEDLLPLHSNQKTAIKLHSNLDLQFVREVAATLPNCTIEFRNRSIGR